MTAPSAAPVGDLDSDNAVPDLTATVIVSSGSTPTRLCWTLLPNNSPAVWRLPARMPGPSTATVHHHVRAAWQGHRRRVRALGPQPPARVHPRRRHRDHPGPLVGRRGTRGVAGRRQRPAEQAAPQRDTFDLGDNWQHLCTVAPQRADPLETLGIIPDRPLPCWGWGWGDIPDQYGRHWNGDDGSNPMPKAPSGADRPAADLARVGNPAGAAGRVTPG